MGTISAKVYKEWMNIDIIIELDKDVIIIENKIDAKDSRDQLKTYRSKVEKVFPDKHRHFVYLTPFGEDPIDTKESEHYTNYSYESIISILDAIITVSDDRVPPKYRYVIKDYISSIRREVIMSDELNEMALKLYYAHKEAFDFILENRPDSIQLINGTIQTRLKDAGFKLGSSSKGYVRFVTESAYKIIPKNSTGWKHRELFLFEISITEKRCSLKAVISPGDNETVNDLLDELRTNKLTSHLYKEPQGKQWRVFYSKNIKLDISELNSSLPEEHAIEIGTTFDIQFKRYIDDINAISNVIELFFKSQLQSTNKK